MDKENCLDGYIFSDENMFKRAQKEKQMIEKLKESLKPDDTESMYQVYNRLADKPCFITPVGLGFLHEMREYLVDTMGDGNVQPVPVPKQYIVKKQPSDISTRKEEKLQNENNALKAIKSKLVIAVVALCVIVIGMIFIVVSNDNLGYFNAEEKVLDKYSAWQERLETWEEQLNEREEMLENSQN